jgi:hypothetical protein
MKTSKIIKGLKFKNQPNKIMFYKKHYEQKIIKHIKKFIQYRPKYIFEEIFINIIQMKPIGINKYN